MPIVRGQHAWALAPGLNLATFGRYREHPEEYRRVVNVKDSKRAYEEDVALGGLGPLAPKAELDTVILDEPLNLGLVRYIHQTFALGIAISKEMRDDDQYNVMNTLAGQLGRSGRYTAELYGHDVYNNAFSTSKYTGRDGLALCSTTHPIEGTGDVYANMPASGTDLSATALEAAVQNFENQVDERGIPIQLMPKVLLVSPENRMNAKRILETDRAVGSNNNDINPLRQEGISVVVSHFLTDKDAWFLLAPTTDLDVNFYWREMPDTKTWDDDNSDATFHKIRQRHSTGFGDWRGVYGSQGA